MLTANIVLFAVQHWWRGRWNITVLGWRHNASQRASIEHQHGWTSLQTWIAALALPIPIAWFAEANIAIGIVIAQCCWSANKLWLFLVRNIPFYQYHNGIWFNGKPIIGTSKRKRHDCCDDVEYLRCFWQPSTFSGQSQLCAFSLYSKPPMHNCSVAVPFQQVQ